MPSDTQITVRFRTIDRCSESRKFATLAGARAYAQKKIGEHPEVSDTFQYAVGAWGDAKIMVSGTAGGKPVHIRDLFPEREAAAPRSYREDE